MWISPWEKQKGACSPVGQVMASKLARSTCSLGRAHQGKRTHTQPVGEENKAQLEQWGEQSYFKYFSLWFTVVAEHLEKPSK